MKVKIISINIAGGILSDRLVQFIKLQKPDILLMQEVFTSSTSREKQLLIIDQLKKILKNYYLDKAATYTSNRGKSKIEAGNAVLTRFPITKTKVTFYDVPYAKNYSEPQEDYSHVPRNLQYVQLKIGDKDLNIFNTHGIWGRDGQDTGRRLHMSNVIVKQVKGLDYVVLGGDFNVDPKTQAIANIEQHLVNIFKNDLKTTFNIRRKSNPIFNRLVVDMMFVSKDIRVMYKECPQVDISDHLPLLIEIEV